MKLISVAKYRDSRSVAAVLLFSVICLLYAFSAAAAESGPRAYRNAPVGTNVLQAIHDDRKTVGTKKVRARTDVIRYYRYIDLFGHAAVVGGFAGSARASLAIPSLDVAQQQTGVIDPVFVFGVGLVGAPALDFQEWLQWQQETIVSISTQIDVPLGRYDKASLLNIGTNRWAFRPELAISHHWGDSHFYSEGYVHAQWFSKNSAYLTNRSKQQSPLFGYDLHMVYEWLPNGFVSVDYFKTIGGQTTVNGVAQNDRLHTDTLGATLRLPMSRSAAFEIKYRKDLLTRSGNKQRVMTMKLQYLF